MQQGEVLRRCALAPRETPDHSGSQREDDRRVWLFQRPARDSVPADERRRCEGRSEERMAEEREEDLRGEGGVLPLQLRFQFPAPPRFSRADVRLLSEGRHGEFEQSPIAQDQPGCQMVPVARFFVRQGDSDLREHRQEILP
ncbi:unnamed protein product [Linum tenue]|uniref:Uncharacterized protein n=1 Tax=Linum tenue TaxID=586396 RepID=A0AAV0LWW1_9ROSI|nr:unnamed protein product [Linum tenue]